MHPNDSPQALGDLGREEGGGVTWAAVGVQGTAERPNGTCAVAWTWWCWLGGATPGEGVILFYVGTAICLVVCVGVLEAGAEKGVTGCGEPRGYC